MKTIKVIVAVLSISLLFASCKNSMDLTKRHYTKGYYFHKSRSLDHQPEEGVAVVTEKANTLEKKEAALPEVKPNTDLKGSPKEHSFVYNGVVAESKAPTGHKTKTNAPSFVKQVEQLKTGSTVQSKNTASKASSQAAKLSGAMLIICVVLCLFPFINLIPVYIHDGNSITMNFWLTLILDLILIGGIIFSLLVVLDVVNLA